MTEPPISPGGTLTVTLLSPMVGGYLRTWTGETERLWRVEDPTEMAAYLACGRIARTDLGEGQFREVGLLDPDRGILVLAARRQADDGLPGTFFQLHAVSEPDVLMDDAVSDLRALLELGVRSALAEHGSLVVGLGGWDVPQTPWVHTFAHPASTRELVVQTNPHPEGAEFWDAYRREDTEVTGVVVDRDDEGLAAAVILAIDAISTWDVGPWDLVLTFVRPPVDP